VLNPFHHDRQGYPRPSPSIQKTAVVLVGHGSRREGANREFTALAEAYGAIRPQYRVSRAYVELAAPSMAEGLASAALERLAGKEAVPVVLVPVLLAAAGHVKNDIGLALEQARKDHPGQPFVASRDLGVHPVLTRLAFGRFKTALDSLDGKNGSAGKGLADTCVVLVGRGSSDPDANGEFYKTARMFGEGRGLGWVLPAFMGITTPSVKDALNVAARLRPRRLVVVPYLLFGGVLADRLKAQSAAFAQSHPWVQVGMADPLGADEELFPLLDERIARALHGGESLPCDNCQYRTPLPGLADRVGGAKALLYSVRHAFAHRGETPQAHAHKPLERHVLVCGNRDCARRGSLRVLSGLRSRLRQLGLGRKVMVTRVSCMGRCGEGPTVAVYPDGVWYRGVAHTDTDELVSEHLLKGRPVGRLVDGILQ